LDICHVGDFFFALKPQNEISKETNREIAKVDIPGAGPVYQDMGRGESTYSWSGALIGDDALTQAISIEKVKDSGTVQVFSFGAIYTSVRIRKFTYKIKRFNLIKYDIELVEDVSDQEATTNQNIVISNVQNSLGTTSSPVIQLKQGQDLYSLANKYNVDWQTIAKVNNITNPRKLTVGMILTIPV
jgi:LysM repeat protein